MKIPTWNYKSTPGCRRDTLQCKNFAIKAHKHSNSVTQCPGPRKETSDHRLHRSLPEENFGRIHQSPACKTNSQSVRSVHSNPEPPRLGSSALQGRKGQLPVCSTRSEMRGSLGASVVWVEMCSCSLPFPCFSISTCVMFSCSSNLLSYLHSQRHRGLKPPPDRCSLWMQEQHRNTHTRVYAHPKAC